MQPEIVVVFPLLGGPSTARRGDRLELFQQQHDGLRGRAGNERRIGQPHGGRVSQHRRGSLAAVAALLKLIAPLAAHPLLLRLEL